MKLVNLSGAIYQLNILAKIQPMDITSEVILDSIFYKALNNEITLDLSYSSLTSPALILVSKIVAVSSTIHTIDLSWNGLEEYGPAVAKVLATSSTICTVSMSDNNLGEYGPDVAKALATSSTINIVNMGFNMLGKYGPAVAEAFAASFTIRILNISWNSFEEYGPAVARAIVKSNTLTSVELEDFDDLDPKPKSEMTRIFTDHNVLAIYHQIIVPNFISEVCCDTLPKGIIDLIGEYAYIPFIEFTI